MKKAFDLIVFDWDGTLIDSVGRIVSSMRGAAEAAQLPIPSEKQVRGIIGLSLDEVYTILFPGAPASALERLKMEYRRQFVDGDTTPAPLFDGARETVEWLKAEGYQVAVATGKARHGLVRSWTEVGMHEMFHASRCADETLGKPHPQMLHELLQETGVVAERALMVGDTSFDLEMAQRANMPSAAALYGAHESHELLSWQPRWQLRAITDLRELLQRA